MSTDSKVQLVKDHILSLLDELPPESLTIVERFVKSLRDQAQKGQPMVDSSEGEKERPFIYPTVPVPASCIDGLIGIMPPVGGDALEDTEALYDEV